MISGVARIMNATALKGEKVDHTLIVEGRPEFYKSEALRALCPRPEWFSDDLSKFSGRDAALELTGIFMLELGEMDIIERTSTATTKRFLTKREDRVRPVWGKHVDRYPRQCIFAATTNNTGDYFPDETGSRRFWPFTVTSPIDIEKLVQDRDQLWAEAVHRFFAGEKWWPATQQEKELCYAEQEARFMHDAWQPPVEQWLKGKNNATIWEGFQGALKLTKESGISSASQRRMKRVLVHLGFEKRRPRKEDGSREWRYYRDPAPATDAALATTALQSVEPSG
jgi:predicted P-loop ATPase